MDPNVRSHQSVRLFRLLEARIASTSDILQPKIECAKKNFCKKKGFFNFDYFLPPPYTKGFLGVFNGSKSALSNGIQQTVISLWRQQENLA